MNFRLKHKTILEFYSEGEWRQVNCAPCFPKSHSNRYFSVLNQEGKELILLEKLDDLDEKNKNVLKEYFKLKNFQFEILEIYEIEEIFGIRHWNVLTSRGKRRFQTELEDWPTKINEDEVGVQDIYGDRYILSMHNPSLAKYKYLID